MKTSAGPWPRLQTAARLTTLLLAVVAVPAGAIPLDADGDMRLGLRAYSAVRIGTETVGGHRNPLSYPHSDKWHMRQHRSFIQVDLTHDLLTYATQGNGPARLFSLFGLLDPSYVSYTLQYRGEFEGLYDYGPNEYRNYTDELRAFRRDVPDLPPILSPKLDPEFISSRGSRLRRIARQRHRLFLAYLDWEMGPFFMRFGRQILAWGETDIFRLLDNINPLDDGFGGFFIALDERRVPLEMLRASWHFGSFGPFSDVFLEGFGAVGDRVATDPGIPEGSPWNPGGLGYPNPALARPTKVPDKWDLRGGARLMFNWANATFTLAHYYTYLDVPGVRFTLPGCKPKPPPGQPCGTIVDGAIAINTPGTGNEILSTQEFPRVPITGLAFSFPVPSLYSIVRAEMAYFQDEPMNRQGEGNASLSVQPLGSAGARKLARNREGGLDPFVWPAFLDLQRRNPVYGRLLQRDTLNLALGLDLNRYIRWLNKTQSFFISTQFFYKHVFDSPGDLVLPVPQRNIAVPTNAPIVGAGCTTPSGKPRPCKLRPRLFHLDDDRFRHTLLITTSYAGGRIVPSFGLFYDWQGVIVLQPGVTFVRDPFRLTVDYTEVSGPPTGDLGTVRDRDNLRAQIEFVF